MTTLDSEAKAHVRHRLQLSNRHIDSALRLLANPNGPDRRRLLRDKEHIPSILTKG